MSSLSKGRAVVEALKVYRSVEVANDHEKEIFRAFPSFGSVALYVFPDPRTNAFKPGWEGIGAEVRALLTDEEYTSARKTVVNAYYTAPVVMGAIYDALKRMGVPDDARVLEPGCGVGGFIGAAPAGMRFTGIEMDTVTGSMARRAYPEQEIRIENFADTRLPTDHFCAVVGNVPFADIHLEYKGHRLSLHDFFIAKALDLLAPGGVVGLVTSRYTMDKLDSSARDIFQAKADLIGAVRLPNDAFKEQGTSVCADILFFRKRREDEAELGFDWRDTAQTPEGRVNAYFVENPDMVLGVPTVGQGQYGRETYGVEAYPDFPARLAAVVQRLQPSIWDARRADVAEVRMARPGYGEGSFYVEDGGIYQVECGAAVPVMHGQTHLRATEGKMGRRLAALIEIRDATRAVLRAQNDGKEQIEREYTRRVLNRAYDRFVDAHGPINKTTFSTTERDGETRTVRRMPNVAQFREDPDAYLVMSIELYDEGAALMQKDRYRPVKAAIMARDVVGPARSVDTVATAEEGLLVSLNERGRVDLDFIAKLYGKEPARIIEELGDLLYHDPETRAYEQRELYLSGNVRRKLAAAQASDDPRHRRNVAALEAVQPVDLLPGEIDANLGAGWIPHGYVRTFVAELLDVEERSVTVSHFARDAVWSVDGDSKASGSVQNTSEFGTGRADALTLIQQALNMQTPTIYDTIDTLEGEKRVLNQEQTFAAKEKQRIIKERWAAFAFADHDRAADLVRIYNDTFNNLVLPKYDGSHLTFPGMAETFVPRQHQRDVTWRCMSSGNVLMAHAVGAGKTASAAMAAMKLKQTGLVQKSMIAIPNHMLEQFGREFLQIYPNARLLVAGKEDLARDRRKLLTAKIATGEWDAIIVTHSSFERIGMSKAFQREFIEREIDTYTSLLLAARADDTPRNVLKHIEKRKMAHEEKLKELRADKKKDDGLVFDELGVGQVFIDESHYFKNMEIATKMDRVAGIQTGGSQRAFDLYMKCQYLDSRTPGRGISFQTGTPISNSMVEMYTIMRYLVPRLLAERGIEHFDAWAAAFGEVVESMEISPDGATLKPRARFSKFVNLPELQAIFRSFADVQTADMLKLPVPRLRGGKAAIVSAPMSPEQRLVQAGLVKRYERIRQGGVNPRDDNALAITTDGRKLALDLRLLTPGEANPDSKTAMLIDNVVAIWERTADRRGTQMIFSDIGVNPTEWGFSVYADIIEALAESGIPREQIANIGDASTDAKKAALFALVRGGHVRVLLGSTAKMGTGTNVQKRLVALHHLDAPWKPAEIEQRDGRILRQGNDWEEVEIFRYVTEGSFDAYMWQALENKARFIAQIMKGDIGIRRANDIGGSELSFAEVKAIASGNPAVLTLAEISADLQRLHLLQRSHADEQFRVKQAVRNLPDDIAGYARRAADMAANGEMAAVEQDTVIGSRSFPDRDDAIEAMNELLKNVLDRATREARIWPIGSYRGFKMAVRVQTDWSPELQVRGAIRHDLDFRSIAAGRLLNGIDRIVERIPDWIAEANEKRKLKEGQLEGFKARVGLPFERRAELDQMQAWHVELEKLLSGTEERERMDAICAEYQAAKGAPVVQAAPPPVAVAEPFTAAAAPLVVIEDEPASPPPEPVLVPDLPAWD